MQTGGSVTEWLACWTQAQKGPGSNHSRDAVLGKIGSSPIKGKVMAAYRRVYDSRYLQADCQKPGLAPGP